MRVVVTGAQGLLGTALCEEFSAQSKYEVVALARSDVNLMNQAETIDAFARARPEVILHAAARVGGIGGNTSAPASYFFENLTINTNVIEAAQRCGARKIVCMGTVAVYSDQVALPMREDDIWFGPPHHSESAYGHAKRAMLAQLEAYSTQYGLSFAFCILTNLFGPHDRFNEVTGHVVPSLVLKFVRAKEPGTPVVVWGSGKPTRDLLYVKDAARAIRLIAEGSCGAINVASGGQITIRELVERLRCLTGFRGDVVWDNSKPDGQMLRSYDISRLKALGFAPAYSLSDALRETIEWYLLHQETART
jgi:GDP-L-fucose synthase